MQETFDMKILGQAKFKVKIFDNIFSSITRHPITLSIPRTKLAVSNTKWGYTKARPKDVRKKRPKRRKTWERPSHSETPASAPCLLHPMDRAFFLLSSAWLPPPTLLFFQALEQLPTPNTATTPSNSYSSCLFISATTTTTSLLFLSLQGYNATLCLPFSRSLSMSVCAKTPDPMSELLLKTQKKVNSGDWTRNAQSQLSAMKIWRTGRRIDSLEGSNNLYPWSLLLLRHHCDEICVWSNRCMVEETARNVFRVSNPTKIQKHSKELVV